MLRALAILSYLLACTQTAWTATNRQNAFETWTEGSDCRDMESACEDWASKGECDKNPNFMHARCALACKRCIAPEVSPRDYVGETLVLNCSLGQIHILPYYDHAPQTSALVMELAHHPGSCHHCSFYRNEAVPQDSSGPPYGLLQGSLAGLLRVPVKEGGDIAMRRGHVAMIPNTREFFINVIDHTSWGTSMTVWGEVADQESMQVVEAALKLPYNEVRHPTYGTVMRMLLEQLSFVPLVGGTQRQQQPQQQGGILQGEGRIGGGGGGGDGDSGVQ